MNLGKVILKKDLIKDIKSISSLYESAGWFDYTEDLEKLEEAFKNSLKIISAWHEEKLIGLIRVVGDGLTIIYIQDIVVLPEYQGNGIGRGLIYSVLDEYKDVKQKILISEDKDSSIEFYKNIGFKSIDTYNGVAFVNYIE
ncbi:GNAT family N-acetyltransferase [Clostridium perfringens]|uniref:GNAT family N-acetyltransferase n=1 Tax=Clostridium perfringens TaxID=1502 RepID=A0AAN3UAY9_CLOPF|nr:GNAT family N-acetyltransferase [Clostridium perfringens]EHK2327293.1 GNAT family N-acetyltransferase [Clostridium perfringens]MBI5996225.1 GNAT family N-acetyltransferase [Clostridium perfringens]MBI6039603.1 GNAT family N-acetyltransferase [Clostridium perfringens]MCI2778718.1 GNAT family N-acetyltransferase [Clostridium perfringens]MCX0380434.1 GNAT family N-acetyltransferase [Clostridium perfringens]